MITRTALVIVGLCVASMGQVRLRFVPPPPAGSLLTTANLSCKGKFRIAVTQKSGSIVPSAAGFTRVSMRYDAGDGKRHYFTMRSNGDVEESVEPTLSSCDTANDSTNIAGAASWGTGPAGGIFESDWGPFPYVSGADDDGLPYDGPTGTTVYSNLKWDAATNKMLSFWVAGYGSDTHVGTPTVGASTMNFTTHTFEAYGCWGANAGLPVQQVGTGLLTPPASWVAANSALLPNGTTNYWLLGLGGAVGYASSTSNGPSLVLMRTPTSGNACSSGSTYYTGTNVILESHPYNTIGPTCGTGMLGCTPTVAPTHPYAAQTSFTGYAVTADSGHDDWNVWGGHGWFGIVTLFGMEWYNGTHPGIIVPFTVESGWQLGTVLASPAPTFDSGTNIGTFTSSVSISDMHDGYPANPFDNIWVKSCVSGVDAGCTDGNGLSLTGGYILSTSGNTITYQGIAIDSGSGNHVPVVGGTWVFGPQYAHANTGGEFPRLAVRMQIIDPNEYVKVLNGTYATTDIRTYTEDIEAHAIFPGLGGPATGRGVSAGNFANYWTYPFNVIADDSHNEILVAFLNEGNCPNFYYCNTVYVLQDR